MARKIEGGLCRTIRHPAPTPLEAKARMLRIAETETGYAFSGDTYYYKDLIKALPGARWVAAEKVWTAPKGTDLTALKAALPASCKPREEWTRQEWAQFCAANYRRSGNIGPCCSGAKPFTQYDEQGPICYRCEKHGETINNYSGD